MEKKNLSCFLPILAWFSQSMCIYLGCEELQNQKQFFLRVKFWRNECVCTNVSGVCSVDVSLNVILDQYDA